MKKKDIILIGAILIVAILLLGIWALTREEGAYVAVRVDGEEVARYNLAEDGEYMLNGGTNVLRIEDGEAYMVEANCPALGSTRCTNQGRIRYTHQSIYCEYNNVFVVVYGSEKADVEIVVG